jgi:hypothetical protein
MDTTKSARGRRVLFKTARAVVAGGKCIKLIRIDAAIRLILLCARAAIPGEQLREGR